MPRHGHDLRLWQDKRERIVTLTPSGLATLARAYPVWKQAQAAVAEAFDPHGSGVLDAQPRGLRKLTRSAQVAAVPAGVPVASGEVAPAVPRGHRHAQPEKLQTKRSRRKTGGKIATRAT